MGKGEGVFQFFIIPFEKLSLLSLSSQARKSCDIILVYNTICQIFEKHVCKHFVNCF